MCVGHLPGQPALPVMTTGLLRGMSRLMFLRLCSRAPRIRITSSGMGETEYRNGR